MLNIFTQNCLNATDFKLQVILLIMEGTETSQSGYYSLSNWDRLPSYHVAWFLGKVAKQQILTKCSICNTFQVVSDLVHVFMNFNPLKIF